MGTMVTPTIHPDAAWLGTVATNPLVAARGTPKPWPRDSYHARTATTMTSSSKMLACLHGNNGWYPVEGTGWAALPCPLNHIQPERTRRGSLLLSRLRNKQTSEIRREDPRSDGEAWGESGRVSEQQQKK